MRFLFFYLMAEDTDRVGEVAPRHAAYWHRLAPSAYLGGPFADRSGGLITFEADTPARAEQLVTDDPFLREGAVSSWEQRLCITPMRPSMPLGGARARQERPSARAS